MDNVEFQGGEKREFYRINFEKSLNCWMSTIISYQRQL